MIFAKIIFLSKWFCDQVPLKRLFSPKKLDITFANEFVVLSFQVFSYKLRFVFLRNAQGF